MTNRYWPLFDLRIEADDVELRPLTESDLPTLAELLPDDFEVNPHAVTYAGHDVQTSRATIFHQGYWKSYGAWSPDAWRLGFAVLTDGRLIGFQELEGNDFPRLRTVDSSSFLIPEFRGRGLGKQMREAVLTLAFGLMRAEAAITGAWHDNHASLGVSRSLGYLPNGELLHRRKERVDVMVHMRLVRSDWLANGRGHHVRISGFEACRPLFGLTGDSNAVDAIK